MEGTVAIVNKAIQNREIQYKYAIAKDKDVIYF